MQQRYLIYKKNGEIDKSQNFIHESCFESSSDEEILTKFHKEGYETAIVDQDTFLSLVNNETTEEKILRLKNESVTARKNYLDETDWYAAREIDQPNSYPSEIKNKRIQAREEINTIQLIADLQQLESFTTDFQ